MSIDSQQSHIKTHFVDGTERRIAHRIVINSARTGFRSCKQCNQQKSTLLQSQPVCSANKDNISNCLPPLNPLIIGLSGDRGVYSRRFTCRSGSVVRPTDPACLLAHLPEIGWLRWWLSVGFIAGNKDVAWERPINRT